MLKNYFKIAFRNLWRKRTFSFINIIGLTVGMAASFLLFLYVHFESGYDGFHSKAGRIYRLVNDLKSPTGTLHWHETPAPLAKAIKAEFPEIQEVTRFIPASLLIRKGNIKFQEEHSLWADPSFFTVFDFPLKYGDAKTALQEPNSIVFSETAARKYFGDANPLGQSLSLTGLGLHGIVTGVMKDMPGNSHIRADMLVSMSTYPQSFAPGIETAWFSFNYSSYILLSPGANTKNVQARLAPFLQQHASDEMKRTNTAYTLFAEPLKDIYLKSSYGGMVTGNLNNVYIFSIIAVFLLLIACVNFINLTTARAVERAKEVGIRKCAGAVQQQLVIQFLLESTIIALISCLLALTVCNVLLPLFNQLAGKPISKSLFDNPSFSLLLFLVAVGTGLLAGVYPALVLSSIKPIMVLKGRFASGSRGTLFRKVLVVTQFTISIALIAATLVVYTQLRFMQSRSLGFNKDQMLVIVNNGDPHMQQFKNEMNSIPSVQGTSTSSAIPGHAFNDNGNDIGWAQIENRHHVLQQVNINFYNVDNDFMDVYKIKLLAGRKFSKDFSSDSTSGVILNKTAVTNLGYPSPGEIIGKRFVQEGHTKTVTGVMDDFHYHSLKETIGPLCLVTGSGYWQYTSLKVEAANLPATIKSLQHIWDETIPYRPFNYFFLDKDFDNQYRSEQQFGSLFIYFSLLAIFISSLGLLGLASYSTLQRTREIGIRKILGASVTGIVQLLSGDFLLLVMIAFVIATPVSWLVMNKWLQGFGYRIQLSWEIFLLAGTGAFLIALSTISFQTIRAAIANPVKSLRTE